MTQIHRLIESPNTVLANALEDAIDLLVPLLAINKPNEVFFNVGTQINGIPHIGTYIVQGMAFVIAQKVHERFGISVKVSFGALDNAPYKLKDGLNGEQYQITYGHALCQSELQNLVQTYYINWMDELSKATEVLYQVDWYKDSQATSGFRKVFIDTLKHREQIRYCVAPSSGILRIRIPHHKNFYAEKHAKNTKLIGISSTEATFQCIGINGEEYLANITTGDDGFYLDLSTLYRSVVKEAVCAEDVNRMYVMLKGGDWTMSTQPIDWALSILGIPQHKAPVRLFTPQVVTETGAKLSKSLIREGDNSMNTIPKWIIDMGAFQEHFGVNYAEKVIKLCHLFLSHPRHMYRSYTWMEVKKLLEVL